MNRDKDKGVPPTRTPPEFTSTLSRGERLAVWLYVPGHLFLLPLGAALLINRGILDSTGANLAVYLFGMLYMLLFAWRFLRRDFDALCDRPFQVIAEIIGSYGVMLCCNLIFSMLAMRLLNEGNPNNAAISGMAMDNYGPVAAMAVYMAPIVEELMFRAGIFGQLRKHNRILAYVLSVLCFSVYHVWGFALEEPIYWIYVLQYIPVSYLLCRCYESTDSIWTSIFFHMLVNGVSMKMLTVIEGLV